MKNTSAIVVAIATLFASPSFAQNRATSLGSDRCAANIMPAVRRMTPQLFTQQSAKSSQKTYHIVVQCLKKDGHIQYVVKVREKMDGAMSSIDIVPVGGLYLSDKEFAKAEELGKSTLAKRMSAPAVAQ